MPTTHRDAGLLPATFVLVSILLLTLAAALATPAAGQGQPNPARQYFTDVELVNQHGEAMRLYSDLIRDKIVLINSMYTDCPSLCPLMSKKIETIQEHVGERMGEEVHLISITVDPETDTVAKMRKFAETFHAGEGWYFLTGEPENVEFALKKLGQFVEDPESHQGIIIMGNTHTGLWKKAFGLADEQELVELFDSVLEDDGPGSSGAARRSGR